jgi:copper(I)-binding protein
VDFQWRRIAIGLVAVCAALTTSACAAGQHAMTAEEKPAVDGAGTTVGEIHLQAVAIARPDSSPSYPAGAAAGLMLVVVNTGQQTDTLTSVTTSAATGVSVFADADAASSLLNASTSPSSSASASASSTAAPAAFSPVDIAAGSSVAFGINPSDKVIALSGLTAPLFGGTSVRITFTFAKAGTTTLTVPVQITESPSPVIISGSPAESSVD